MSSVLQIVRQPGRVLTIRASASISAAAQKMCENHIGCLVVVDGERRLAGIITERDILNQIIAQSRDPAKSLVGHFMKSPVFACTADAPVSEAQQIMARHGVRHLPILEHGVPVGMVSSRDILGHDLSEVRAEVKRQSRILDQLEREFPGIASLRKDDAGRIVI